MEVTKIIKTPVQAKEVTIKTIITGAERETIDSAQMDFMKTTDGKTFEVTDMGKVALAQKHALLKICVTQIGDSTTNLFEQLQKFYEEDYDFVFNEIMKEQKKSSKRPLDIQTL